MFLYMYTCKSGINRFCFYRRNIFDLKVVETLYFAVYNGVEIHGFAYQTEVLTAKLLGKTENGLSVHCLELKFDKPAMILAGI